MSGIKRPVIQLVDPRYLELQRELCNHPELQAKLRECNELGPKMACIGLYLGVGMDLVLDIEQIHQLMERYTQALRAKRTMIILPVSHN